MRGAYPINFGTKRLHFLSSIHMLQLLYAVLRIVNFNIAIRSLSGSDFSKNHYPDPDPKSPSPSKKKEREKIPILNPQTGSRSATLVTWPQNNHYLTWAKHDRLIEATDKFRPFGNHSGEICTLKRFLKIHFYYHKFYLDEVDIVSLQPLLPDKSKLVLFVWKKDEHNIKSAKLCSIVVKTDFFASIESAMNSELTTVCPRSSTSEPF